MNKYLQNTEGSTVWIINQLNLITEITRLVTPHGIYTKVSRYMGTKQDILFLEMTSKITDKNTAYEFLDDVFEFYQELFITNK
jgi:hypothetical protein